MEPISAALAIAKACGIDRMVGRWLGGDKGGDVARKVIDAATGITGGRSAEEIVAALQNDSKLSHELTLQLNQFAENEDARVFADIANARAMQVAALQQEDVFAKRFVYYFATAWSLAAIVYIGCITFCVIPPANMRYADTCLGFVLGTLVATIINFFFGSSRSSQRKDAALGSMASALTAK